MTYWIYIKEWVEDEEMDNSYDQGMVYIENSFDLLAEAEIAKGGSEREKGLLGQDPGDKRADKPDGGQTR